MHRLVAAVALTLVSSLALFACPPPIDTGDGGGDGSITVGPAGGTFIRAGYGILIPAGAVSTDTLISVSTFDTGIPEVPNRKRISYGFRFSPTSLKFATPVTIYLPWLDDRVPTAVDPGTFDMRRQAGAEAYAQLPGTKTDTTPFKAVEAQSDRLGVFWVTSPTEPNIARLEISPTEASLRVGGTQQFTARVVAPTGETLDVPVTWGQVPARVGTTDTTGLYTARDPGTASVVARAGSQVATAKVFVQGSTGGAATWLHQNPFPTGNDLFGGAVAPAALGTVFAGENGTVLVRKADGTWTRLFSTPNVTFTAVGGTTPDNAVAIGRLGTSGVLVEFHGTAAPTYKVYPPTQVSDLVSLWFDGTHGMGVGSGNDLVIRRNGAWTTEYHPSFEKLLSVIGDGAGGFVVVGELGSLYKWDPVRAVWDSLFDQRLSVRLDAAQLMNFASGETWAVGGNKLFHFTQGAWVAENLPATPVLAQATTLAVIDGHVVIGGQLLLGATLPPSKGAVLIRTDDSRVDGGVGLVTWSSQLLRALQVPRGAFGSGGDGYVVGDLGAVWRWHASSAGFVEESHGFQGDVSDLAVLPTEVYAGVNECVDVRCAKRRGGVMHGFGAGQWEAVGTFPSSEEVLAVAAKSSNEVLASTASSVFRWDGSSWVTVPVASASGAVLDLQYCGATVWGAGENGAVYRGSLTQLANAGSVASQGNVSSLYCPSETELWVAGDQFFASRQTNGVWSAKTSDTVTQATWKAVWSPGPGEGFAFGDARYGVYFDSATLTAQESLGVNVDVVNGLWGTKIDDLVMVGRTQLPLVSGFAVRFDGVNWRPVDLGSRRMATAVHGSSSANVWIGTEGGGVLKAVTGP
jgi:hypothetical protein